ncbi:DUF6969 family protein [Oceanibacterium hippocampi]|uniref:DUF6969 domain-containing protein n=1 Tax=Oceanibacterium hippocampi TaxID=745714 RepID=A0A1Y5TRE7_9PROT|nr:hypothetical protein [Oceanibacterium hippocampi]SLN70298.1 hypothetical protein OCH7691_03271 [Oceanibacterium hippocampi]
MTNAAGLPDSGKTDYLAKTMASDEAIISQLLSELDSDRLKHMHGAAAEIIECYRVLRKGGLNVVGELLKGQGTFYEWNHFPEGDIYDSDSHAQYYYHAHRGSEVEHGHFHTFVRVKGMPKGLSPVPHEGTEPWPEGDERLSHLIAVSMDKFGFPIGLFTTNRWVTGENWYRAEDVIAMLDRFVIDHANPSWPVNRWLTAMLRLFRPQIEILLVARDRAVEAHKVRIGDADVFEDRALEITSDLPISVETQTKALDSELRARGLIG